MHVLTYPPLTSPLTVIVFPIISLGSAVAEAASAYIQEDWIDAGGTRIDGANAWTYEAITPTRRNSFRIKEDDFIGQIYGL